MATATVDDDELTDEQINQLLAAAHKRLQAKASSEAAALTNLDIPIFNLPKLQPGKIEEPYISSNGEVATLDAARLTDAKTTKRGSGIRIVEDPVAVKKDADEKKRSTAGASWFHLPKTNLTPELKRDLQLLRMRNVLDPQRHYKKDGGGKMQAPEYSQVGTVIEGAAEFFSGRIEKKKRKKTFVEEVLAGERETKRFSRKYGEVQGRKTSGKKAFYKATMERRRGSKKKGA